MKKNFKKSRKTKNDAIKLEITFKLVIKLI